MTTRELHTSDPDAPPWLAEIGLEVLFLRGALPPARGIAIVGTRKPAPEAVAFTRALARDLARAGLVVWSGGAMGIDAAAHLGALDGGGPTVVVTGGGFDRPYPKEHAALFEEVVARGGALAARVPDPTNPCPVGFHQRNEVLAAATVATLVVEAPLKSGARSTAAAARRLGRGLFAVPHAPWDERGAGCGLEIALGARAITSSADLLRALDLPAPAKTHDATPRSRQTSLPLPQPLADAELGLEEGAIVRALSGGALHLDELCEATGLPAHRVAAAVLTLTLRAIVVEAPPGFIRLLTAPVQLPLL